MQTDPLGKKRKRTKALFLGPVKIGGDAPVVVQSMTSTDTRDIRGTLRQIRALDFHGCEIVRLAIPDEEALGAFAAIRKASRLPLVADIHFNYRLAIGALDRGAEGIRINPGNLSRARIREIVAAAIGCKAVIRIGVNSGSLQKDILARHGGPTAEALVESAMDNIALLEDLGFTAIKVSLKSSHVPTMVRAYRLMSKKTRYPLHLGVTEAGGVLASAVKSSLGIGLLLSEGIGDTVRVSVTGDPVNEVRIAYGILRALGIRRVGPDIVSCPTCGRCEIDLDRLVSDVEKKLAGMKEPLKIALMGCVVNGPGEAAEADIGIAGGRGSGLLFRKGKVIRKVREKEFISALMDEIDKMMAERGNTHAIL
ncbi:MAG TPA: flavodoxin-dependent (E)-4-hydroxy-3-methylbut-2-enyl-diphosphate synthase [Syntrophales bacterium]|nr:flavodoxin-dependent (E)-4-hydroxy-3-methylbut-2-enyl-diphosphate synthase [Syntrophales bacterium]HOX93747.1 flavodoxin-dependent (E)-4-hydroxy-3-methylbut-2-enyl-diphosphate synthase [Syntrophales bacterium]HPI55888.1 flavodoxin-dependent (E)-4-hydroxy-3-methylbut-2-enyl-diphosphate synthase [Syntrophales bacterium]HPN23621.1 flavodoxin-dependent (E)-4-hydroxy-3-methylbut-2-enyl-diphosphate synthase [Syntrophales bacterium]HQM27854.1 flavodoxin-dependent (E)-4-hydroxy-3-methylbut-2-enyl-di